MQRIRKYPNHLPANRGTATVAAMISQDEGAPWNTILGGGPVLATAIHAGHRIRAELQPWLVISDEDRLREEDPMTDYFLSLSGNQFRANRSRFEFDLNRSREQAVTTDPEDTWGLKIWDGDLPEEQIKTSLALHDNFYQTIRRVCDDLIKRHEKILILDLHSFNHQRDGKNSPQKDTNPDIDMGVTELNRAVYGDLLAGMTRRLRSKHLGFNAPDVRENVRFPDGGHFPEWLHSVYGDSACVLTLEYKKTFMDEWSGTANILKLQRLRQGLQLAIEFAEEKLAELQHD